MKPEPLIDWEHLKALAMELGLPGVEETTSWGQPSLKAHGKLWLWWSPTEDAPVFKVPFEEREFLIEGRSRYLLRHPALSKPPAGFSAGGPA